MSFSLKSNFTPLSVDDVRSLLGDAARDSSADSAGHYNSTAQSAQNAWEALSAQFVATDGHANPGYSSEHRNSRRRSDATKKRWKGKTKRKGGKDTNLGLESIRHDFPSAWFRGRAHRSPLKAHGYPWDEGDGCEGHDASAYDSCSDDEEVLPTAACYFGVFVYNTTARLLC